MTRICVYGAALGRVSAEGCYSLLDNSEKQRASAIAHDFARVEFIKARALLRLVLADHATKRPNDFTFATASNGKPYVADDETLEFNVSHSNGIVLIAVARSPVGIDIEAAVISIDQLSVADTVFSRTERAVLRSAPEAQRANVFLSLWTRKEAYLKATGRGFSSSLDQISSVSQDGRIVDHSQPLSRKPWYAFELPAPQRFKAALVAQSKNLELSIVNISDNLTRLFQH